MKAPTAIPLKTTMPPPPQLSGLEEARMEAMLAAVSGLCAAVPQNAWREVTPEQIAKRAVNIADATLAELQRSGEVPHGSHR